MHSALDWYITLSDCRELGYENARKEADGMYDLLVRRHGLLLLTNDDEHQDIDSLQNGQSNMLLTETSLRAILAGQFPPARGSTFDVKFQVAMRSTGWPAKSFLDFLAPCSSAQLATSTDNQRRTAMHWAAKHFGYWVCTQSTRDTCPDGSKVKSYATLLEKLLMTGGNVHAVDSSYRTPLMVMLHQFAIVIDWPACSRAVEQWGQILSGAGLDLNEYIRIENSLLMSLADEQRDLDQRIYVLHPCEVQLVLNGVGLAMKVKFCRRLTVWEHYIPPGAWDPEPELPKKSILYPSHSWKDPSFWHEAAKVSIFSDSYLIQATPEAEIPFWSSSNFADLWRSMFMGVQDDHGPIVHAISHDISRNRTKRLTSRKRASSVPCQMMLQSSDNIPESGSEHQQVYMGYDHWIPIVYRCLGASVRSWFAGTPDFGFSFRVGESYPLKSFDSRSFKERLEAKDDWVIQLLREKIEDDIVQKFADQCCPDLRDEVKRELAEARSIAELAKC